MPCFNHIPGSLSGQDHGLTWLQSLNIALLLNEVLKKDVKLRKQSFRNILRRFPRNSYCLFVTGSKVCLPNSPDFLVRYFKSQTRFHPKISKRTSARMASLTAGHSDHPETFEKLSEFLSEQSLQQDTSTCMSSGYLGIHRSFWLFSSGTHLF